MADDERFLAMMSALSDPNRLQIMNILRENRMCSFQILKYVVISQPTLSHHMSVLLEEGLVRAIPAGRWYDYEVDPDVLSFLEGYIGTFRCRQSPL
ncbi:MAG: winged helix-turn-helix domain-containing protein [Candidatus Methanomethylophilaceae archaeon]